MVKLLLEAGANIESKDNNGQTPLWWAARSSNVAMVKLLLEAGANIESKDTNGQTPLWWAARNSNVAMVKLLLEAGTNIESKDTSGQTPLWWAARNSNVDMVKLLLEAGANIESKDDNSQTPLFAIEPTRVDPVVFGAPVLGDSQFPLNRRPAWISTEEVIPELSPARNLLDAPSSPTSATAFPASTWRQYRVIWISVGLKLPYSRVVLANNSSLEVIEVQIFLRNFVLALFGNTLSCSVKRGSF
jgi:hypothetical protein